jgi:integrase
MTNIASIAAPIKTPRKGRPGATAEVATSVYINAEICKAKVEKRTKFFDTECEGFYVEVSPRSANFHFRYRNDTTGGKQRSIKIDTYDPKQCTPIKARATAYHLKGQTDHEGINVAALRRQELTTATKHNKTVAELIALRIEWMQELEPKYGAMLPRIESWKGVAGHLNNLVKPRLGRMRASEVTRADVAQLSRDIVDGKDGFTASVSNARHMRRAVSGMYNWAIEHNLVPPTCQPCVKLGKLKEQPRERFLSEDEIRTLWHGLDRADMPWARRTRLCIKLALVTMLRSQELLGAQRNELHDLPTPMLVVDKKRVKLRRDIHQPLNSLAREIIAEAKTLGDEQHLFASPLGDQPMERKAMATALRGTTYEDGRTKTRGICALLGLAPFTPHDLRRTASTLAGEIGCPDGWVAKCLDHANVKDEDGKPLPRVTRKHYNLSKQLKQKRFVLDQLDAALRRIIAGLPLEDEPVMRIAA